MIEQGRVTVPRLVGPAVRGIPCDRDDFIHTDGRYMRARIPIGMDDDCSISERPLWWPPNRLCGRFLAPYLSSRLGGGAVMFQDRAVAVRVDSATIDDPRVLGDG